MRAVHRAIVITDQIWLKELA